MITDYFQSVKVESLILKFILLLFCLKIFLIGLGLSVFEHLVLKCYLDFYYKFILSH